MDIINILFVATWIIALLWLVIDAVAQGIAIYGWWQKRKTRKSSIVSAKTPPTEKGADVIDFPRTGAADEVFTPHETSEEFDILSPILETAAKMMTLNNKPYLNLDEIAFYLDIDKDRVENLLTKYGIHKKLYLTGKEAEWVVPRELIENLQEPENSDETPQ